MVLWRPKNSSMLAISLIHVALNIYVFFGSVETFLVHNVTVIDSERCAYQLFYKLYHKLSSTWTYHEQNMIRTNSSGIYHMQSHLPAVSVTCRPFTKPFSAQLVRNLLSYRSIIWGDEMLTMSFAFRILLVFAIKGLLWEVEYISWYTNIFDVNFIFGGSYRLRRGFYKDFLYSILILL